MLQKPRNSFMCNFSLVKILWMSRKYLCVQKKMCFNVGEHFDHPISCYFKVRNFEGKIVLQC